MKWWWQKHQPQVAHRLTAQNAWRALPKGAQTQITRLDEDQDAKGCWWLQQQGQCRDLALMTVALPERSATLSMTAEMVAEFAQNVTAKGAVPMALLVVDDWQIDAGIMAYLAKGTRQHGHQAYVLLPIGVLYDFLASATMAKELPAPTVGELLDGWPMRQAATLAAYVLDDRVASRLREVPVPECAVNLAI